MPKSKDDLGLVLRAAQFAAHKHKGQRRKDVKATPYINHPINLAEVLHTDGGVHDPIVIAAALLQVAKAGRASERVRQVKLADKICNLRDILASPPSGWSLARRQKSFDWAKEVVDQVRGVSPRLERTFDRLYRLRPVG